jgi:hypothetical protein
VIEGANGLRAELPTFRAAFLLVEGQARDPNGYSDCKAIAVSKPGDQNTGGRLPAGPSGRADYAVLTVFAHGGCVTEGGNKSP